MDSPFKLKYDTARALGKLLNEWELYFEGRWNNKYHYAFQIQRFHVWAYWRPMTVARFERMTLDYRGPYLPIFASRTEYVDDERIVHEGFDFAMSRNHRYRFVPFYFVLPGFLLQRPWPAPREWCWHPAVKVTKSIVRDTLRLEDEYGGWSRNRRGHLQIPKITGCSGKDFSVKAGEGWASFGLQTFSMTLEEQQELFRERADSD